METADTKYLALNYTQERWVKLRNINDILPKAQGDQLRKVAAQMQNSQKGWPQILDKVYQYPSDRRYADIHKAANAFGEQLQWLKDPKICICCEMPINTRPISLDYPTIPKPPPKDHKHFKKFKLKSSTSIFFSIIKIFIAYLLIRIIISDSYNIYTSYRGSYCLNLLSNNSSTTASQSTQQHQTQNLIRNHLQAAAANSTPINASTSPNTQSEQTKESCVQDFRASFSNYNKHSQQDAKTFKLMDYLNIAVTLVSIMFFLYCRQQLYKINNLIEFDRVSQDNYSLLVENIPLFLYKPDLDPPQEGFTRVNNYGIKQTYGLTQSGLEYNYEQVIKKTIQDQSKSWLKPLQKINQEIKKNIAQNLQKCPLQSDISQEQQLRMVHKRTQLQKKLINLQQLEHITDPFIIEYTSKLKNKLLNILFKQSQSGAKVVWKKRWLEMDQFIHREEELVKQSSKIGQLTICFDSKQIEHLNYIRQQLMNKHSNNVGQDPTYTNSIKMEEYRLLLASKHEKFVPNQVKQINTIQVRKINEYLGYFQHIQPTKLIPLENKLSSVQEEELKQFIVLNFLGKAFVTFQHEYFKDYLLDEYAKNSSFLQIQGNVLQISQASEPTDVNWQNLRFTSEQRSKQGMLSLVSIYTTFLAFFVILFAINYVANMQKDLNVQSNPGSVGFVIDSLWSKVKTFLFEFLLPTTITITNLLVKKLINKFTEEERHISVQKKTYRYVQRTIQFQFLNTAILYFILGFIQINGGPLSQEGFVIKTLNLIGMTFLLQFVITNFKLNPLSLTHSSQKLQIVNDILASNTPKPAIQEKG